MWIIHREENLRSRGQFTLSTSSDKTKLFLISQIVDAIISLAPGNIAHHASLGKSGVTFKISYIFLNW